jgi:hypothetical protein
LKDIDYLMLGLLENDAAHADDRPLYGDLEASRTAATPANRIFERNAHTVGFLAD